jgi:predicted phage terminase large subunit-like protein
MTSAIFKIVKTDFLAFARMALRELDGTRMSDDRYLELLASELIDFADGKTKRLLMNLPPRHLKTQLCTVCFAAWILAHEPETKIMLITYGQDLAADIGRSIRNILEAEWFKKLFETRIAKGFAKVRNFATTAGGRVYSTSFDGSIVGFGADIIFVDDPHNASDISAHHMEHTIVQFHSILVSRLNDPEHGRIMVVCHRVHENDLSASLTESGDWTHVALPLIAAKTRTYQTQYGPWRQKKGEVLRARKYDKRRIEKLRRNSVSPPFELFYQQDVDGRSLRRLKPTHFLTYEAVEVEKLPHFISVDTGTSDREGCSFSVVLVWASNGTEFFLADHFRKRCDFGELVKAVQTLANRYRGAPILIEETANGPALYCELTSKQRRRAIGIRPVESKVVRFRRHVDKIVDGCIRIPKCSLFNHVFVDELMQFPKGPYDDQVDAMTQFLDWIEKQDDIDFSQSNVRQLGIGAIARGSDYRAPHPARSTWVECSNGRGLGVIARPEIYNPPFAEVHARVIK